MFGNLPPDEIERRRQQSIAEMKLRDKEDFSKWYQEHCDKTYWTKGKCCSGCDHWISAMGDTGQCEAAGIVFGMDVFGTMGIEFSSYRPEPDFPCTHSTFYCGKFQDSFDWSTLDPEYLERIGAIKNGTLKIKPEKKAIDDQAP